MSNEEAIVRRTVMRSNADAQVSMSLGGFQLPQRTVVVILCLTPFIIAAMQLPFGLLVDACLAGTVVGMGFFIAKPNKEGIWLGTYLLYSLVDSLMVRAIVQGQPVRAKVEQVGTGMSVDAQGQVGDKDGWEQKLKQFVPFMGGIGNLMLVPRAGQVEDGLFELRPGGWRAILKIQGPGDPLGTRGYQAWQESVITWLGQLEMPAQFYSSVNHFSRAVAEDSFEEGVANARRTKLIDLERDLYGEQAAKSIAVTHYVILLPTLADGEGNPIAFQTFSPGAIVETDHDDASGALTTALKLAGGANLSVEVVAKEEIGRLLDHTVARTDKAAVSEGVVQMGDHYSTYGALIQVPEQMFSGEVIELFKEAKVPGALSLHILPMRGGAANKVLEKNRATMDYLARKGDKEANRRAEGLEEAIESVASGAVSVARVSLMLAVEGESVEQAKENFGKVKFAFARRRMKITEITLPGMAAAAAVSPGGTPMKRGLTIMMDLVTATLVPALGTPFSDQTEALVGQNANTGSPVYIDIFGRHATNSNLLVVGTTGAGKSVAQKTLLIRHVLRGARAFIIDPDSEYGLVVRSLNPPEVTKAGMGYIELGEAALNVLARPENTDADDMGQWMGSVIALLSVMAGEEVSYSKENNAPIRTLGAADKAWLQTQLSAFFEYWDKTAPEGQQPILSSLIWYLENISLLEAKQFKRDERVYEMILRLKSYTQGDKGRIFDRESHIDWLTPQVVGVGLKTLAMKFDADMTAALAFALTAILVQLGNKQRIARKENLIVLVDEAHRVVGDPEAATVLNRLVRQARKYGAGVWLGSQSVHDFMAGASDTLANLMGTRLVMGLEENAGEDAKKFFNLSEREMSAIVPLLKGRGVLVTATERAVVDIKPGEAIMRLASTTFGGEQ